MLIMLGLTLKELKVECCFTYQISKNEWLLDIYLYCNYILSKVLALATESRKYMVYFKFFDMVYIHRKILLLWTFLFLSSMWP